MSVRNPPALQWSVLVNANAIASGKAIAGALGSSLAGHARATSSGKTSRAFKVVENHRQSKQERFRAKSVQARTSKRTKVAVSSGVPFRTQMPGCSPTTSAERACAFGAKQPCRSLGESRHTPGNERRQMVRRQVPPGRIECQDKRFATQGPNPSVERTHNGGAQWHAPSRVVPPLCAAHVKR